MSDNYSNSNYHTINNKLIYFQDSGLPLSPQDARYIKALTLVTNKYPNYEAYYTYFSSTSRINMNYASNQHTCFYHKYPESLVILIMLDNQEECEMKFIKHNFNESRYDDFCDLVTYSFKF